MSEKKARSGTSGPRRRTPPAGRRDAPRAAASRRGAAELLEDLRVHQVELETQNEELRTAQLELKTLRDRYFDLYNTAPVGYITLDASGLILEGNLTVAKMLGVRPADLVRAPLTRFILPADQDIYYRHRRRLLASDEPRECEVRLRTADSTDCWARIVETASADAAGAPMSRVVLSDVTDRRRAEDQRAATELQTQQLQKAESLGRMAGAIAHHFNNLLAAVMGNIELASAASPVAPESEAHLDEAMRAARRAAAVGGLMLTYLGQTPSSRDRLDLAAACRRYLPMLRAAMPKTVVLETDLPSPGPFIDGNANQIHQVLANIVTNGWESAVDGHGEVRVSVGTVTAEQIPVASRVPLEWHPQVPAYAYLKVSDTGSGIEPGHLEQLFDPFFSTKFTGRGLGLSVALGIVRSHAGAITVESQPGRGSVFGVLLPLSSALPARQSDATGRDASRVVSGTVLIVDDEPAVLKLAGAVALQVGFSVLTARDGIEAVEVFREHKDRVACVVCDLTMPRMDGWATLTALRRLASGVPAVLVSGYEEASVIAGEHPDWPDLFLSKPYHVSAFRKAIVGAIEKSRNRLERGR
jgi:two-component system cell cycle sensor histidine kinase/response regulator CckA